MPWVPTTDFEEEVVNLQPDHDFIYGVLTEYAEPEYNYPRPEAHIEYAAMKKLESKIQQEQYELTGKMNKKLNVITQVQRMAGVKQIGEQPTINDWDSNEDVEKEIIGMMRHCGLGPSVEQPLSEKVTIATFPVENAIKIVKSGRRKIPLFFDENVFKLKPRESHLNFGESSANSTNSIISSSSDSSSCNSSKEFINVRENNSSDSSFNTSLSLPNTFYTGNSSDLRNSNISTLAKRQSKSEQPAMYLKGERCMQYDKLLEDTSSLSLGSSPSNNDCSSFKTASECRSWKPISEDDNNILDKNANWPILSKNVSSKSTPSCGKISLNNNNMQYTLQSDVSVKILDSTKIQTGNTNSLLDCKKPNRLNNSNECQKSSSPFSSSASKSVSYAEMAKKATKPIPSSSLTSPILTSSPNKEDQIFDIPLKSLRFYTPRKVYDLKRGDN